MHAPLTIRMDVTPMLDCTHGGAKGRRWARACALTPPVVQGHTRSVLACESGRGERYLWYKDTLAQSLRARAINDSRP